METGITIFGHSHCINNFSLLDTLNKEVIIAPNHSFNLELLEEIEEVLNLKFNIFPYGSKSYQIVLDPLARKFIYQGKEYSNSEFYKVF